MMEDAIAGFFPQHEVHVGRDLGGRTTTIGAADVAHYEAGLGGPTPALAVTGRRLMTLLLLATAVPTVLVAGATSFTQLLVYAFLFGIAGNSFSIGIAWNAAWADPQRVTHVWKGGRIVKAPRAA